MTELDNENNNTKNNETEDVKPVKLSKGATVAILIAGVIIILIIGLTIRGCTLEKDTNSSSNGEVSKTTVSIPTENSQNMAETNLNNIENSTVYQEVGTTSNENLNSSNADNNGEKGNSLKETPEPNFGEPLQTTGIVVSKHCYSYDGSYIYSLTVSMLVGDITKTAQYFCPKNSYDALNSADAINITYQQDTKGSVSISSISK